MGFKCGIVGLPNVGKSTLFNALINSAKAQAQNYPFCTIEPNIGMVEVPDERLRKISDIVNPDKTTPTTIEFVDIAGLVKGASKGEGLGNQFLANIRSVDAIAHVVRCFDNSQVSHVHGKVSPKNDIETVNLELILKDLETVEKRIDKTKKLLKAANKKATLEIEKLSVIKSELEKGKMIYSVLSGFDKESVSLVKELQLLTAKPVMFIANVDEASLVDDNGYVEELRLLADKENIPVVKICAKVEAELVELPEEEKKEFLKEFNMETTGLSSLIREGYGILGLITFFTAGKKEVKAWTVKRGTNAQRAAGKIHSDIERGFIRAEVVKYDDFIKTGSMQACKDKGLVKLEGKDYIVEDGDIIYFRFNV